MIEPLTTQKSRVFLKRALHVRKRVLCIRKRALNVVCGHLQHDTALNNTKEPCIPQKSPVEHHRALFNPKEPVTTQKSPLYSSKEPCITQKSVLLRKRALYNTKEPWKREIFWISVTKRALCSI